MSEIVSCLLLSLLLSLFTSTSHASQKIPPSQIEFWTMQLSPFHDEYIKGVVSAFETINPDVRVKWVDVPWAEMEKKTLTAVAGRTPPDVVNLNPQFASKLAEFGALANPEQYLSADDLASYLPGVMIANRLNGKLFALPWYLTTNVVLYNKAVLYKAGVAPPSTYAELIESSKRIRAATGGYAYFPALDGSTPLETLVAMGGSMLSANGCKAGFNNAEGERILSFYQQLYQQQLVPKNVVTEGHRKAVEMFLAGEVAMITTGMQFIGTIKNSNPGFYKNVGVANQLHAGVGHTSSPPNIAAMNVAVLNASNEKQAAFRFAAFLTNAQNQTVFAKRVAILPSSKASYSDPFFSEASDDLVLSEAKRLSVAQVQVGKVLVPPMHGYNKFRSTYARNLQAVMLKRKTVQQAMSDLDQDFTQLLANRKECRL